MLAESEIKNFVNGDQEVTLTCPNTGRRVTVPMFPRGFRKPQISFDTSRYKEPGMKEPDSGHPSPPQEKTKEEGGNF